MSPTLPDLVDSHCHLDFPDFENELPAVIARAHAAGVTRMVTICTRLKNEPRVRAIAEAHDLPIHFIGIGERAEDLRPFSAEAFAKALVGIKA